MRDFFAAQYSNDEGRYVHLSAQTSVYDRLGDFGSLAMSLKDVSDSTLGHFAWVNAVQTTLPLDVNLTDAVRVDYEKETVGSFGGWKRYYEEHPRSVGKGLVSRVGFDETGTEALLYFGIQSRGLAGSGHFVLLRLQNGKWSEVERTMAWIS